MEKTPYDYDNEEDSRRNTKKHKRVYMEDPPAPCVIPETVEIEELIRAFQKLRIS